MFDFNEKKKKTIIISTIVYAILILLFILIVNFEKFKAFFSALGNGLAIFAPIFIGAIIAYLCLPLVRLFQNKVFHKITANRTKHSLSVLCTYISLLVFVVFFVALIVPQLLSSVEELIVKMTDGTYLNAAIDWVNSTLNRLLAFQNNYTDDNLVFVDAELVTRWVQDFFKDSTGYIQSLTNSLVAYVSKFVISIKNLFLGLLISIYFVVAKDRLQAMFKKACLAFISPKKYEYLSKWAHYSDKTFGGFVVGKLIDATFMMVMCAIAFSIAKMPYAILIATIIGIGNIIPYFGPFLGAIPSGFIVLIASPSKFLLFCILLLLIQQFDANVFEPKIVGEKTGLSSLGVIIAVIIMGGYFGIIGTFFGVPIFAVICSLTNAWIDSRLHKKDLPVALAEYYSKNALIDDSSDRVSLWNKTGHWLNDKIFSKVKSALSKRKKVSHDIEKDTKSENNTQE